MKKLISLLIALLVFTGCAACAESSDTIAASIEITFRNGISFGMTQDEVMALESEPLHEQTFGEGQNPHVTVLATDTFELEGHNATLQYLFWDGSMYAVLTYYKDADSFDVMLADFTSIYGDPSVSSAEGTANWVESVSGNRPSLEGEQYVWTWSNNISLTTTRFSSGFITLYLDMN